MRLAGDDALDDPGFQPLHALDPKPDTGEVVEGLSHQVVSAEAPSAGRCRSSRIAMAAEFVWATRLSGELVTQSVGHALAGDLYLAVPLQMGFASLAARLAQEIAAGRWSEGESLPGVRKLAREVGCSAGTAARAYAALRDAGVLSGTPRSRFVLASRGAARAAEWDAIALRLAGSDDPALDLLVRAAGASVSVVPGPRGSVNGIVQLSRGTADASAVHLFDVASGRWNDPLARGALGGEPVRLVHLWRRELGLVVAAGNPDDIRRADDLQGKRIAWRAPGTGSRLLLERLMRAAGCEPRPELGEPVESHLAVAAAVSAGAADAGLAVRAVAESGGLDWIPVATEPFELAINPSALAAARPLLDALAESSVHARVAALPGYDLSQSGEERTAA
jgi:molybdate-binding protein